MSPTTAPYDAMNKGIKMVKTSYFMLVHSGDEFIGDEMQISEILNSMISEKVRSLFK